jgi:multicomponent Na+:H+ antiporter subunit E
VSQLSFGFGFALVVAVACAPMGAVAAPWKLVHPRRLVVEVRFAGEVAVRIARANVSLAWRFWHPRLPLRTGMLILPTKQHSEGGLTAIPGSSARPRR